MLLGVRAARFVERLHHVRRTTSTSKVAQICNTSRIQMLIHRNESFAHLKIAKMQLNATCPGVSGTRNTSIPVSSNRRMHSKACARIASWPRQRGRAGGTQTETRHKQRRSLFKRLIYHCQQPKSHSTSAVARLSTRQIPVARRSGTRDNFKSSIGARHAHWLHSTATVTKPVLGLTS